MKRITINNLDAGIVDAVDPSLIADNACVEIENYEYRDYTGLKKRKGVDISSVNDAFLGSVESFCVWYPPKMPDGATDDKIIIAHANNKITLTYKSSVWTKLDIFDNVSNDLTVRFFVSYGRVLIADGVNSGRYLTINKDAEFEYGEIGLPAPLTALVVSTSDNDVVYAEVGQEDTGMTVERGNILQYCYTVEDKYGNESNPSPISTEEALMYKYLDASSPTGFKYYYKSVILSGFDLSAYADVQRDKLKYFNIYRKDVAYNSGTVYTQFAMVKQVDISLSSGIDSQGGSLNDISYENVQAPASTSIIENAGVIYLGGVKQPSIRLPFYWDRYVDITIANNNNLDYCNSVIGFALNYSDLGIRTWAEYLSDPKTIRLFYNDLTTPLPVVCVDKGQVLYLYTRVPQINRSGNLKLYLALADTSIGVDPVWNDYGYGRFFDFSDPDADWSKQRVFIPSRVENADVSISIIEADRERGYNAIPNVADVLSVTENVVSVGQTNILLPANRGLTTRPFAVSNIRKLSPYSISVYGSFDINPVKQIKDKSLILIKGAVTNTNKDILTTGNLTVKYNASTRFISISLGTELYNVETIPHGGNFSLAFYVSESDVVAYIWKDGDVEGSYRVPPLFTKFAPAVTPASIDLPSIDVIKVIYAGSLNTNAAMRMARNYALGIPHYAIPVGSDISLNWTEWSASDVEAETKRLSADERLNLVQWSGVGKDNFPVLNFKQFREEVLAVTDAPSFLKQQYQNTIIVFTRNTVNRIVLSDDLNAMAALPTNVVEEMKSAGLYSVDSLVNSGNAFYWLSEIGVIRWSPDGLANLSRGKKVIPLGTNYIGAWIPNAAQYVLHNRDTRKTYVYHELNDAWTEFSGFHVNKFGHLNLGSDVNNNLLIYDGDYFVEYPSASESGQVQYRIASKKILLDNIKPHRYRVKYKLGTTCDIDAVTFNHYQGSDEIIAERNNAPRFEWIMLPNGFWGEYIQFVFNDVTDLTQIDLDLREGI